MYPHTGWLFTTLWFTWLFQVNLLPLLLLQSSLLSLYLSAAHPPDLIIDPAVTRDDAEIYFSGRGPL